MIHLMNAQPETRGLDVPGAGACALGPISAFGLRLSRTRRIQSLNTSQAMRATGPGRKNWDFPFRLG
jgi:hypothetical protein